MGGKKEQEAEKPKKGDEEKPKKGDEEKGDETAGGSGDSGGSGASEGGKGGGAMVMCLRVTVAIVASILIILLVMLVIMLGFLISASTGKAAQISGEDSEEGEFTGASWFFVFLTVLASIALLAQIIAFVAVICMNSCLASIYAFIQIGFLVFFTGLLILFIYVTVITSESEAEKVTDDDDEVVKPNVALRILTGLTRFKMDEEYETGLGDINEDQPEQAFECCGLVSPDENWNIRKRLHDPILKLYDENKIDQIKAVKKDPREKTGGSWWHIKCLQDNNPGKTNKELLDKPMCYAPKSCCKEDKDGCNDASITLKDLHVNETSQLQALIDHDDDATKALWEQLRDKQTGKHSLWKDLFGNQKGEDLVTPVNKAQMFDESCMKKLELPAHHLAIILTICCIFLMLMCIVAITIMCCLQSKM